jgi:hypothetical protein
VLQPPSLFTNASIKAPLILQIPISLSLCVVFWTFSVTNTITFSKEKKSSKFVLSKKVPDFYMVQVGSQKQIRILN